MSVTDASGRDFLTPRARQVLERSREGHRAGKVDYALYREIEQQLLDSYEANVERFENELDKCGA